MNGKSVYKTLLLTEINIIVRATGGEEFYLMNGKIFNYPVLRGRRQSVSRINRINSGLNVLSSVSPLAVAIFSDNIALPVHFRCTSGALPALYQRFTGIGIRSKNLIIAQ